MDRAYSRLTHKLLLLITTLALSHFGVVIWHLILLARVQPEIPRLFFVLLTAINSYKYPLGRFRPWPPSNTRCNQ